MEATGSRSIDIQWPQSFVNHLSSAFRDTVDPDRTLNLAKLKSFDASKLSGTYLRCVGYEAMCSQGPGIAVGVLIGICPMLHNNVRNMIGVDEAAFVDRVLLTAFSIMAAANCVWVGITGLVGAYPNASQRELVTNALELICDTLKSYGDRQDQNTLIDCIDQGGSKMLELQDKLEKARGELREFLGDHYGIDSQKDYEVEDVSSLIIEQQGNGLDDELQKLESVVSAAEIELDGRRDYMQNTLLPAVRSLLNGICKINNVDSQARSLGAIFFQLFKSLSSAGFAT